MGDELVEMVQYTVRHSYLQKPESHLKGFLTRKLLRVPERGHPSTILMIPHMSSNVLRP